MYFDKNDQNPLDSISIVLILPIVMFNFHSLAFLEIDTYEGLEVSSFYDSNMW